MAEYHKKFPLLSDYYFCVSQTPTTSIVDDIYIEQDDSLILVYQDEAHFQIQTTVTAAWYKRGSVPTVKSFPGRFKVSYSGFVIPESGELFACKPEKFITRQPSIL